MGKLPAYVILFFLFLLGVYNGFGQDKTKDVLNSLDSAIAHRQDFLNKKLQLIDKLKYSVPDKNNLAETYDYYLNLYKQYQSFKFDSAFYYVRKLNETARQTNNAELITSAKIEFSNILITAGIFSESLDTLKSLQLIGLSPEIKANYYQVLGRGYFDMESFSQSSEYAQIYRQKGLQGFDSAMVYLPETSWQYLSLKAQVDLKTGLNDTAKAELKTILNNKRLSNSDLATQLMLLAFTYGIESNIDKEIEYLAKAAIADLNEAKKEAVALLFLANILYESGDVIRASKYVNIALEDSRFYGSNFRLWQISNFLPFIKAEHIVTIEKQKRQLWNYALAVTLLAVLVGMSFFIIMKQIGRLRKSKKVVENTNNKLAASNEELLLANRIKEEYIGYYFEISSQIIDKLDNLKQLVTRRLNKKQLEELRLEVDNINIHKEKSNLYFNFDKAFLEIFPEFVNRINMLLKPDEHIQLKDGQLLNTELRIFALIRLGIHDADKLARILGNSVNTIYAYKSKIKNKAKNPEHFEQDVMLITRTSKNRL
jgi:DNA-binding CsgD family transcriptional regulator